MATLAELFEARSGSLLEQLRRRSDPTAAANAAAEFLDALRVEFLAQDRLSPGAIRLVPPLIETIKESFRLAATGIAPVDRVLKAGPLPSRRQWRDHVRTGIAAGLALLLLAVLILAGNLLACMILLLLAVAVGSILFGNPARMVEQPADRFDAVLAIRPDLWIDTLRGLVLGCDRIIARADEIALTGQDGSAFLADHPDLLDLFQDLLEAAQAGDGAFALQKIGYRVPRLLRKEGIDVVSFDGANESMFDVERSLKPLPSGSRTVRPALVQGDRCLKTGRAERAVTGAV
jgi:hypothetical protein